MSEVFGPVNSTFSRFCIHRAESPIVAASGCPSTSFSPAPSAAVSRFRASKILRLGLTVLSGATPGRPGLRRRLFQVQYRLNPHRLSLIIIDPAGMVPLVVLRRTKKPESARGGTCRDHAINGPRSWTTQSRGTPAIDAQRLNWLRRRRAIRSGGGAHPLAATRRLLRSVMVGA